MLVEKGGNLLQIKMLLCNIELKQIISKNKKEKVEIANEKLSKVGKKITECC